MQSPRNMLVKIRGPSFICRSMHEKALSYVFKQDQVREGRRSRIIGTVLKIYLCTLRSFRFF